MTPLSTPPKRRRRQPKDLDKAIKRAHAKIGRLERTIASLTDANDILSDDNTCLSRSYAVIWHENDQMRSGAPMVPATDLQVLRDANAALTAETKRLQRRVDELTQTMDILSASIWAADLATINSAARKDDDSCRADSTGP